MLLWRESKVEEKLAQHAVIPDLENPRTSRPYQVYGDAAYGFGPHILSPFAGSGVRTQDELLWNSVMGKGRVSTENVFAIISNLWPFLRASWKMRIYQSPVGRFYRVGVLLANAVNCCYPNQIAQRFKCKPPTLDEYFHH
ncbi:hypothetical protein M422DRAFT_268356 [Sphaerobolus stellatus SS14]|uniref:DDE Tnp4 domain-containing protein n=1 Tax=Sphaerobolus stellatus (strain SS14) TaxID=990650 RepID=A0A0C9TK48_SPHS4|nr:hypothetical protein M422DRAFT_268356 [Sphaerobolus stellatus SS14]